MPTNPTNPATPYDLTAIDAAVDDLGVEDPDERAGIARFARETALLTPEQLIARFARILSDDLKEQRRMNTILENRDKRLLWLVKHTGECVSAFFTAMQQPRLLFPSLAIVSFAGLFAIGQGDRALDIAESVIEKYAGVDIHGHGEVERARARLKAKAKADAKAAGSTVKDTDGAN